ncbi:glycosyltransferase [Bacillus sp. FJAT-18017]|uniref:glycosyltransferase n=1 Tax=Bacillus sp. FJAT-18017 TaxID=1705566 RepID=UPI0006AE523E|nr:glycosyltransferase [Bacillus sp. FJAT-18017]
MVTVVTSTKRGHMFENVIDNFSRQNLERKELIIVINNNNIKMFKPTNPNIRVFQLDESKTLGECLNFGFKHARYPVVAKFDDDDYYSPDYLSSSIRFMEKTGAGVVGKSSIFVYFKKDQLLTLYRPKMIEFFIKRKKCYLAGGTLVIKREVFGKVMFRSVNHGEDIQFQKDCLDQKITLYSGSFYDYVLIRYEENHQHSWQVNDEIFQKQCKSIAVTKTFEEFVWKRGGKR